VIHTRKQGCTLVDYVDDAHLPPKVLQPVLSAFRAVLLLTLFACKDARFCHGERPDRRVSCVVASRIDGLHKAALARPGVHGDEGRVHDFIEGDFVPCQVRVDVAAYLHDSRLAEWSSHSNSGLNVR
jgi:hypothetical protein